MKHKLIKILGKDRVVLKEPLSYHTTFAIGGPASYFYTANKVEELVAAVKAAVSLKVDHFILGAGSNLLVADKGFAGLVIKNNANKIKILADSRVASESGVLINSLINFTLKRGLTGLEDFVAIPGSVGGAVYNNIHGEEKFFSDFVETVLVLTKTMASKKRRASFFNFAYDYSYLKENKELVLEVVLKLNKGNIRQAEEKKRRLMKEKSIYPKRSAGCIFQNLPDQSVGFLIDKKLKLKGKQVGKARISPVHAGFIENLGGAKAADVLRLIKLIQEKALKHLRFILKPEIQFLGFTPYQLRQAQIIEDNDQ